MVKLLLILAALWAIGGFSTEALAQTVPQATISWRANTESDLAGYRVYQSTSPGSYATGPMYLMQPTVIGVTVPLPRTRCSVRYYWVVTAFDFAGQESGRSVEVSKTITGTQYWTGACRK